MYRAKTIELGITSKHGGCSEQQIQELEQTTGISLPSEYKEFLLSFGTLGFHDQEIAFYPVKSPALYVEGGTEIPIVNFYGLEHDEDDISVLSARYKGRLPDEMMPIAECPGGDQLSIGLKNEASGRIYYWNHNKEKMQVNLQGEMWAALTLISYTFNEFMVGIGIRMEDEENADPMIQEIKISDKFLSRLSKSD